LAATESDQLSNAQTLTPGLGNHVDRAEREAFLIRLICSRLETGKHTLSDIARETGVSIKRLLDVCNNNGIRYPYRQTTNREFAAAVSAVVERGLTVRAAAKELGLSKSTVHRCVASRRRKITRKAGAFQPVLVEPYRCPRHGRVNLKPCPACAALQAAGRL
jgi:AraC-like DNA-binding protein